MCLSMNEGLEHPSPSLIPSVQPEQNPAGRRDEFSTESWAGVFAQSSVSGYCGSARLCLAQPRSTSSQEGLRCLNAVGKKIPRISNIFLKSQASACAVEQRCGGNSNGLFRLGKLLCATRGEALGFPFQGFLPPAHLPPSLSLALVQLPFDLGSRAREALPKQQLNRVFLSL